MILCTSQIALRETRQQEGAFSLMSDVQRVVLPSVHEYQSGCYGQLEYNCNRCFYISEGLHSLSYNYIATYSVLSQLIFL